MPQEGVDFGMLNRAGVVVEWLCAPVAGQTAAAVAVVEARPAPGAGAAPAMGFAAAGKKALADVKGSPVKIQVSARPS
jgi:hypothetical protein